MTQQRLNLRPNELKENKEGFRLIWLDTNIIDNSDDSTKTQTMLRELNPAALFYTDSVQCINAIESIENEQILFIVSDLTARPILPKIQHIRSIIAIFIVCTDRPDDISFMNEYHKIVGIFTDQNNLLESIRQTLNLLEKQSMTFSLFDQKQKSSRDLSKESVSFLWHQIIIYVLKQIPETEQSKQDLIIKCREYYQFNKSELKNINEFEKHYCRGKAIEWYAKECFLYKLLNRALRTEDIELIYSFRFFIIHLCSEIKEYSRTKNSVVFTTYRGQTISNEEFDKWRNNIGTIISFNSFFSTSRDEKVSLEFARHNVKSNDATKRILFEIEVDPSIENVFYADISDKAQYKNEREILFNLNSLFKIISIELDSTSNVSKIKLKTTDEGTDNFKQYLTSVQQQIDEGSPIICFGWLLLNELGQIDQAEKYFRMLLKTLPPDHENIVGVYNGIGCVHSRRKEFDLALENYEKAYNDCQTHLPPNDPRIVASLNNMANIHQDKKNFTQALEYYQRALMIEEANHPNDHQQKAMIIQNIGRTLKDKDDLDNALQHLNRALNMLQCTLPENDHKISICLGDIGLIYEKKGDFEKALDYYQKELDMDEQCLPSDHPHLLKDIKTILAIYKKMGDMPKALEFCRKKLEDQKQKHGTNHPRIIQTLMTMAKVLAESNFSEAHTYYREALTSLIKSTPPDNRAIATCLTEAGILCRRYKIFDRALDYLLQAVRLYSQLSDPIDIASACRNIGHCYREMNKPSEALYYYKKSLAMYRVSNRLDHENVKLIEADIAALNAEQQTTTSNEEIVKENVNDEKLITVANDPDVHLSFSEPSTPESDQSKPKTSGKWKLCPNCQIL
jgi:tetratricopeptide (TPR) repeat protein